MVLSGSTAKGCPVSGGAQGGGPVVKGAGGPGRWARAGRWLRTAGRVFVVAVAFAKNLGDVVGGIERHL